MYEWVGDMVERRPAERPAVCLEFAFDRLLPIKLQQAYELLVASRVRPVGQTSENNRGDSRETRIHRHIVGKISSNMTIWAWAAGQLWFRRGAPFLVGDTFTLGRNVQEAKVGINYLFNWGAGPGPY
jgi:hypothetical protein